jgi:hypothetical protein
MWFQNVIAWSILVGLKYGIYKNTVRLFLYLGKLRETDRQQQREMAVDKFMFGLPKINF